MSNQISDVSGIKGFSSALNGQPGQGTQRANPMGASSNPNGTKPPKPADGPVAMPK
jgi:hypothetical protein